MTPTHDSKSLPLAPGLPVPDISINGRCSIFEHDGVRDVWAAGTPIWRYHVADDLAERVFVAQALEAKLAKAGELAVALSRPTRTIHRIHNNYVEAGVDGLVHKKRGPKGARLGKQREQAIKRGVARGLSNREMARRLGVCPQTVNNAVKRMGLRTARTSQQQALPGPGAVDNDQADVAAGDQPDVATTDAAAATPPNDRRDKPQATTPPADQQSVADRPAEPGVGEQTQAGRADATPITSDFVHPGPETAVSDGKTDTDVAAEPLRAPDPASSDRPVVPTPPDVQDEAYRPVTLDTDPTDRSFDRLLAATGELDDAAPLFGSGDDVPRAGVLLAVPLIVASGLFDAARKVYGSIGPAFYGLRTTLLTLVFLALVRIKRPENLKEYSPPELGRILGLDRSPEMKTLRRKLARLAEGGRSEAFLRELVRHRVESRSQALGFLYVDGHVRVYSGKADLPKTHVARMRISLPATQDVWVNDANGDPVFFVTQRAHPQLVGALPPLLRQVRRLVGKRRVTVVFDRGGWSPELFRKMFVAGFDVLTYRKGKSEPVADHAFATYCVPGTDGKQTYATASGFGWIA